MIMNCVNEVNIYIKRIEIDREGCFDKVVRENQYVVMMFILGLKNERRELWREQGRSCLGRSFKKSFEIIKNVKDLCSWSKAINREVQEVI